MQLPTHAVEIVGVESEGIAPIRSASSSQIFTEAEQEKYKHLSKTPEEMVVIKAESDRQTKAYNDRLQSESDDSSGFNIRMLLIPGALAVGAFFMLKG